MKARTNEVIMRSEFQRRYLLDFIAGLSINPDHPFRVTVEPYKKKRSLSQNALLWARYGEIIAAIVDYTGHDQDELHDWFKQKFLTPTVLEINGEVVKRYSSKNLTTAEMTVFMDQIEAFATQELGLLLPRPEDRFDR